ncbi:DinB family protein [Lacipirellula sp.]|uniref:DinB family protein n=1 Tax=Lacipirellula sp. TaxID=2691419 RepID=UPI003D0DD107
MTPEYEIGTSLLAEFEQELGPTRKFLERVPEERLAWRPHEKSMTAGQLALHIAQVPEGVLRLSEPDEAPVPDLSSERPQPAALREILDALNQSAAYLRQTLPTIDDERMSETFRVTQGGHVVVSLPRAAFLRSIMLNHWYHHRGQLGVYLRLLSVAVPSSYGPSGDEMPDFASE